MKTGKVAKSAFWYTASNLLVKALGFITIPIFTRILSQDDFGIYNNYLSWLSVMTFIVSLSLEATLISAKRDFLDDLQNYVFSMICLSMLSASLWLCLSWMMAQQFQAVFLLNEPYILSMFIYLIFFPIVILFQTWERYIYKYKTTVAISLILAIGIAGLSVGLAFVLPSRLEGVIFGRILPAMLVGSCILIWFLFKRSHCFVKYWRYALPIALPYIPHLLALTLLGAMNKVFITHFCGNDANALYSLANSCGLMVAVFLTSLNSAFSPWMGDQLAQGRLDRVRKAARPYLVLFCIIAIAVALFAPEALLILGGTEYISAQYVMAPVTMNCILQFAYCMYVNVEQYEKRTKGMAFASVSAALLNACLDVLLIPVFGYISAAYASVAAYLWLMIAHILLVRRIGFSQVYDNRFNLIVAISACAAVGGIVLLYPFPIVRGSIFALIAAILLGAIYKNRVRVKSLLA